MIIKNINVINNIKSLRLGSYTPIYNARTEIVLRLFIKETQSEVVGLIPGFYTILNVDCIWNGVHPALWGTWLKNSESD